MAMKNKKWFFASKANPRRNSNSAGRCSHVGFAKWNRTLAIPNGSGHCTEDYVYYSNRGQNIFRRIKKKRLNRGRKVR